MTAAEKIDDIPFHKHHVKVPANLKAYKDAIGAGIFYLALGQAEVLTRASDDTDLVTVEFTLSAQAEHYLNELLKTNSKREVFKSALAWVSRQPSFVQFVKL